MHVLEVVLVLLQNKNNNNQLRFNNKMQLCN
jgi:hypothetical protein